MKHLVLMCLLLYRNTHTTQSEISSQNVTEGGDAILYCKHDGRVMWDKGRDGQRVTILTADNEETKKLIQDPQNRYSVLGDLSLHIKSVSLSDSGIYYCNATPAVNLIVTSSDNKTTPSSSPETTPSPVTPTSTLSSTKKSVNESPTTQSNYAHSEFKSTSVTTTFSLSEKESMTTQSNDILLQFTSTAGVTARTSSTKETSSRNLRNDKTGSPETTTPSPGANVIPAVVLGGVVFVVLILLLWAYIRRKAASGKKENVHIYETVNNTDSAAQPDPPPPAAGPMQKQNEPIYYLAGDPDIVRLGQRKEVKDDTYTLISESQSKENLTDEGQNEPLYSTIK